MTKWLSEVQPVMGYNRWLRDSAVEQLNLFQKSMDRLQDQLSVLPSVLQQEEMSSAQLARTLVAINHLLAEIHLLVTLTEEK